MIFVWWGLTVIFTIISLGFFIGMLKPNYLNQNLKEGEQPWTRQKSASTFIVCMLFALIFVSLATHNGHSIGQMLLNVGSFGFLVFIVWAIVSRIKKTGKAKKGYSTLELSSL